ncbi:hypothetical protein PFLUV_G00275580 [Perca fluviatilis]|uniref:Uncharacterized protein n=1 Tax=Perca fluviatilis TaxID=8168 RepID=A0A6A5E1T2_PERFL|nr:hypothetical protein PFLUV_G00275580 [Perca fluviatilis]
MDRHRKQLEEVLKPETKPRGEALLSEVHKVIVGEEHQQEWSSSLDQEDTKPPHIKEEQEELPMSQEGEQLQGLEEADITKIPFTPVPVKSEDDKKNPQFSQLHQIQTEELKTEADGEDCGGPEPAMNSDPDTHLQPDTDDKTGDSSEPETDDIADWKETREPPSGLNSLNRGVGPIGTGRYPLKPRTFASLLETEGYPEYTAQPATMAARSTRESHKWTPEETRRLIHFRAEKTS